MDEVEAPAVGHLTVLYDAECALCRWVRSWLESRTLLVPLDFVPVGSAEARRRFPGLDHERTHEEVTVVADTGEVWAAEAAWAVCLWATAEHRGLADRIARPRWRGSARSLALAVARITSRHGPPPEACDYGADCDRRGPGPDDR
jgi:predicted DCC family thiol-disulfide oxidoreductase YuxK